MAEARRFNVVACGRRLGKTLLGNNLVIGPALEGYPTAWFSPTYKMLGEVWRETVKLLAPITASKSTAEHQIRLKTGGIVDMWSLKDPDAGRGRKYKRIVIDEAAMVRWLQVQWEENIRATLTDLFGDAYFLSTPKGLNFFHVMYLRGLDEQKEDWMSWRMPTIRNPYISKKEVEDAKSDIPERTGQQEFDALFLEFEGMVFRRLQQAAIAPFDADDIDNRVADPLKHYVIGVDWGKMVDFTVFSVFEIETKKQVYLDRFNKIDYPFQAGRLKALAGRFGVSRIVAESNAMGLPIIEQLQRENVPIEGFVTTNATKAVIVEDLALAFENQQISIINDPVQMGELQQFEGKRLPASGMTRYSAPDGMHDDTVIALALAWSAVKGGGEIAGAITEPERYGFSESEF